MRSINKMGKRNRIRSHKGFSLIEIIIAIAILGVVSVTIVLAMTSSSRVYSRSSVEAQIQSEAELVSNAISEKAIDASNALDEATPEWLATLSSTDKSAITSGFDYQKGTILVLDAVENVGNAAVPDYRKVQYVFARSNATSGETVNSIYQGRRQQDADENWGNFDRFHLLGNNIEEFNVDAGRVDSDNLLTFALCYDKTARKYQGNYQVLMRNKAYARVEPEEAEKEEDIKLLCSIQPKFVYLAVKQGEVREYYEGAVIDSPTYKKNIATPVTFRTTVVSNQNENLLHSHWKLTGTGGDNKFDLVSTISDEDETSTLVPTNTLVINATGNALKTLAYDQFNVQYFITTQTKEGTTKSSDKALSTVRMLRVKNLTLSATSGFASKWNDSWEGSPTDGAQGYAYTDSSGKIIDMGLNASIDCTPWIPYGGGVSWTLEKYNGSSWESCSNPNFAKLKMTETKTSTMNTLQFGKSAMNGQLYKITATSMFDPDYYDELIVGIGKQGGGSGDGFYSRGFYIDLTAWMEQIKGVTTTVDHIDDWANMTRGDNWENANVEFKKDPQTGRIYVYVNYDSFSYTQNAGQRVHFYDGTGHFKFYMYDADGNKIKDANGQELIEYKMQAVKVTKESPTGSVVVVSKGSNKTVRVRTWYYNLLDKKYFGINVDDTETNLNRAGMADYHKDVKVETSSAYGDVYHYVDAMSVTITPKTGNDYNPYPMRLRLSALDYYELTRDNSTTPPKYKTDSYTDYMVYVANVKGSDVFIPGPNTKGADAKIDGSGIEFPDGVTNGGAKKDVGGYDSNGSYKSKMGQVYKKNNKTYLDYNGTTYTYSPTYSCWNK